MYLFNQCLQFAQAKKERIFSIDPKAYRYLSIMWFYVCHLQRSCTSFTHNLYMAIPRMLLNSVSSFSDIFIAIDSHSLSLSLSCSIYLLSTIYYKYFNCFICYLRTY